MLMREHFYNEMSQPLSAYTMIMQRLRLTARTLLKRAAVNQSLFCPIPLQAD